MKEFVVSLRSGVISAHLSLKFLFFSFPEIFIRAASRTQRAGATWLAPERLRLILVLAAPGLIAFLSACGGGGGGGASVGAVSESAAGSTQTTTAPPTRTIAPPSILENESYWTANDEYRRSRGLSVIKADSAYARGATGAGETIGFVDTGLLATHDEFSSSNGTADKVVFYDTSAIAGGETVKQMSHGTAVASIAAGRHGVGTSMQGVAFDAKVAMWALLEKSDGSLSVDGSVLTRAYNSLINVDAHIINNSWAVPTRYNAKDFANHRNMMQTLFGSSLSLMERSNAAFVFATGNDGSPEPAITGALPIYFPGVSGKFLAVTSVGLDGVIDSRANRCGVAASFCVAAPGGYSNGSGYVVAASSSGGYRSVRGTSFAAAYVSGVLALMGQVFGDQMTAQQYVQRLLETAKKDGIYGDSSVYGQGLIDAAAAVTPVGTLVVPQSDGGRFTLPDLSSEATRADDVLSGVMAQQQFIALDALGDPFAVSMSSFVNKNHSTISIRFDNDADDISQGVMTAQLPQLYEHPHEISHGIFGATRAETSLRLRGDQVAVVSGLNFYPRENGNTKISAGVMLHKNGLLALSDTALFSGSGIGETVYVDFSSKHVLPNDWQVILNLNLSRSDYRPDSGLVENIAVDQAREMRATFLRGNTQIRAKFSSLIDQGNVSLNLPVRRNSDGSIIFERRRLALNDQGLWQLRLSQKTASETSFFVEAQKDSAREQITMGVSKQF